MFRKLKDKLIDIGVLIVAGAIMASGIALTRSGSASEVLKKIKEVERG